MNNDYILAKYLRISDDDGRYGESQSIEGQRALLDDFIALDPQFKGCRVLEFVDDGLTGTNFNRPGVKELLAKARAGGIQCILVKDFSRFGRSYIDVGDYLEQIFPFLRVRFISVNDHFDSDRQECSAGDVGVAFKSLCNDYYSKDLSRKIRAGLEARRGDGRHHAGAAIFGYKKAEHDRHQLVPDEEAAPIVRRVFAMRLAGVSIKEIAKAMNAGNIPTPARHKAEKHNWKPGYNSDNIWLDCTVRQILRDIRYTGVLTEGMSRNPIVGSRKHRLVPKEQWTVTPGTHEALVSDEEFERAQVPKAGKPHTMPTRVVYPLSGMVRCGGCGHAMERNTGKYPAYRCAYKGFYDNCSCPRKGVKVAAVEGAVTAAVQKLLNVFAVEEVKRQKQADKRAEAIMALAKERQSLERRAGGLQNDKLAAYTRYCDGGIGKDEYRRLCDAADVQIGELLKKTGALERKIEARRAAAPADSASRDILASISFGGNLTREITEALIGKVIIHGGGNIEIVWKFADVFSEGENNHAG